mmetsp:Transcript_91605/g.255109  ORF Transcript_91605/g.255109 Transcript_91605/m.255109 type:complete len:202 (-) Transcript_91605:621-1226(-)
MSCPASSLKQMRSPSSSMYSTLSSTASVRAVELKALSFSFAAPAFCNGTFRPSGRRTICGGKGTASAAGAARSCSAGASPRSTVPRCGAPATQSSPTLPTLPARSSSTASQEAAASVAPPSPTRPSNAESRGVAGAAANAKGTSSSALPPAAAGAVALRLSPAARRDVSEVRSERKRSAMRPWTPTSTQAAFSSTMFLPPA